MKNRGRKLGVLVVIVAMVAAADRVVPPPTGNPPPGRAVPHVPRTAPTEDPTEVLIAQALDQPTELELKDVPIREAVERLAEKTGVPIEVITGTVRFLPYGSQTMVTAAIQGQPLREALTALVQPIGLQFRPEQDRVIVEPSPPLARMARRASWPELDLLASLISRPWTPELFASLKFQFQDSSTDDLAANLQMLKKLCGSVGAGSAAEVLEHATDHYGWTWYVSGEMIAIISKPKQIERQLERRVTLQYNASLKDALLDLGEQAGVLVRFDPGVLATLPSSMVGSFTLSVANTTVRQALEVVAGQTGLSYFIEPDGIRFTTAGAGGATSSSQQLASAVKVAVERTNPIIGSVQFPTGREGATFSIFVRENDLPPDVSDLIKARKQQTLDWMRTNLEAEHSRTSSRPTD